MMKRRDFLGTLGALPATSVLTSQPNRARASNRPSPNIIFFFIDDMGWQDTSVPFHTETTELNRRYHTPNMERLAASGTKFTQAYATAVCSPSRVSLMTGLNAARHRVTNWTLRRNVSPDTPHPDVTAPEWNINGLQPEPGIERSLVATTLPQHLQQHGYKTIHVGKGHFGVKETPGDDPRNLGFDVNIGGHAAGGPGSFHGQHNFSAAWRNGDRIWDVPGLEAYHGQDIHLTEALTIEALREIDTAVEARQPFYLYMSHYAVHAPWERDDRFYSKYREAGMDEFDATYASMLEGMDHSLGEILDSVDAHGIADNTVIVFMTDNGSPSQTDRNRPLRGHKLTPYEGGIRVPMLMRYPGRTQPGSQCEDYLVIEDIFPTFLEIAGIPPQTQEGGVMDGRNFLPPLDGTASANDQRPLVWHFPHNYGQTPYSAIRLGDWKLIYHHADSSKELYNLRDDLSEEHNCIESHPEKTEALSNLLAQYLADTDAQMAILKANGQPAPLPNE